MSEPLEQTAEQFDRGRMGANAAGFLIVLIAAYMAARLHGNDITPVQAVTLRIVGIVSAAGLTAFIGATFLSAPIKNGLTKAAFIICIAAAGAVSDFILPIKTRESVSTKTEESTQPHVVPKTEIPKSHDQPIPVPVATVSASHDAIAVVASPNLEEFNTILTTCAAGSNISLTGELKGELMSAYKDKVADAKGAKVITSADFLNSLPAKDRLAAYLAYQNCIVGILTGKQTGAVPELTRATDVSLTPLFLSRFADPADPVYFLTKPISWKPNADQADKYQPVEVPTGFVVTFDSIPRVLWSLIRPDGDFAYAAIIHEYLYWTQTQPREVADDIFKLALENVVAHQASDVAYQAVRTSGEAAWEENARLKARGEKRILKEFPTAGDRWADWKRRSDVFSDASP